MWKHDLVSSQSVNGKQKENVGKILIAEIGLNRPNLLSPTLPLTGVRSRGYIAELPLNILQIPNNPYHSGIVGAELQRGNMQIPSMLLR